jgi:hypothetical protein
MRWWLEAASENGPPGQRAACYFMKGQIKGGGNGGGGQWMCVVSCLGYGIEIDVCVSRRRVPAKCPNPCCDPSFFFLRFNTRKKLEIDWGVLCVCVSCACEAKPAGGRRSIHRSADLVC